MFFIGYPVKGRTTPKVGMQLIGIRRIVQNALTTLRWAG